MFTSLFSGFINTRSNHDDDSSDVDLFDGSAADQQFQSRRSNTAKDHPYQGSQTTRLGSVVEETPSPPHDDDDDVDGAAAATCDPGESEKSVEPRTEPTSTRTLLFKVIEMQMEETESFEYLSNVLNWKAEPFVGQRPNCPSVQFGPYNLAELIDAVKSTADASGIATYAFRGARKSAASCSIKFGCDHGRLRYGKEKDVISKKNQIFCQRYAGNRS